MMVKWLIKTEITATFLLIISIGISAWGMKHSAMLSSGLGVIFASFACLIPFLVAQAYIVWQVYR